ncbi:MAG: RNA polymerase sigma factor [Anaerolineales bacterium]|jgi:RNA polymerase sigma-70 factor (ECF subfamily)
MRSATEEKRLLEKAKRGDRRAVGRLYDDLFPGVYGFARIRLPTAQDAEDVVSETFLAVVDRLPEFKWNHAGGFKAWVFQIARSKIANFYRTNGHIVLGEDSHPRGDKPSSSDVEDIVHRSEMRAALMGAIHRLQPRQEEVVLLRYFGGLRNREIAEVLAINEKTVSAHVSRALKFLQDEVDRIELLEAP